MSNIMIYFMYETYVLTKLKLYGCEKIQAVACNKAQARIAIVYSFGVGTKNKRIVYEAEGYWPADSPPGNRTG